MKTLLLADLSGCQTQEEAKDYIACQFEMDVKDLERFAVLIGYISVGDWGCDSSAYFLLQDHKTGVYYETFGSHCSCYGFEGQWEPEEADLKYLKSEHFYLPTGEYDEAGDENERKTKEFMLNL